MGWLEQNIAAYEKKRWLEDSNRRVLPFGWGLEHIGIRGNEKEPRAALNDWAEQTLRSSETWFHTGPAEDCHPAAAEGREQSEWVLSFTSAVRSPWPENNRVHARLFPARRFSRWNSGPAVVVLPQWNAAWDVQVNLCRWLNRLGITALRLSLPYHDRRRIPGHERADHLVGPNIGLTLQANQQAVLDTRRALLWLAGQGYGKLGLVGTSIGSAVGFITMAHDPLVRASVFLHVSTYFGDVVRTGMNTSHVWESLRDHVTSEELRRWWAPISPFPYVSRMRATGQKMLMVSGRYDRTFWPELSAAMIGEVRRHGIETEVLWMPCGHYSLERLPFSYTAALAMGLFLFRNLA